MMSAPFRLHREAQQASVHLVDGAVQAVAAEAGFRRNLDSSASGNDANDTRAATCTGEPPQPCEPPQAAKEAG